MERVSEFATSVATISSSLTLVREALKRVRDKPNVNGEILDFPM
jgi:hypothetical protein